MPLHPTSEFLFISLLHAMWMLQFRGKIRLYLFCVVWVFCLYKKMCVHKQVLGAHWDQKRVLSSLELESWMVWTVIWVLKMKHRFSVRGTTTFKYWAICLSLVVIPFIIPCWNHWSDLPKHSHLSTLFSVVTYYVAKDQIGILLLRTNLRPWDNLRTWCSLLCDVS